MIQVTDKKLFWEFLYGIEGLDIPDENGAHHTIAGRIEGIFLFIDKEWKLEELKIKDPFTENFIKLNKYEGTISEHIKSGKPTIRTLNSFIAYFFLNLSRLESEQGKIDLLIKLEQFFHILDASQLIEKYFVYTEELIDYLLKTIDLDYIHCKLDSSFNLSFINTDIENKKDEYLKGIIGLDNRSSKTFSKLDNYRNELRENFKEIRVGFSSFSIPIQQVIELPFYRKDDEIDFKIESLKKSLQVFKENNDLENTVRLSNRIKELKKLLKEPNNPNEILNRGEDIFISSPAGSGKTTVLKSFAHMLASDQNRLPIFIELQSYKSDLDSLISKELELYGLDIDSISKLYKETIVLLLDGFDEYSGSNELILVNEIINFKKISGCQVVFTGRFKPKNIDKIKFYFYQLSGFSVEDINRVFRNIFPNKGQKYFDILHKEDLLRYVVTPLFLFFLITYLKQNDEEIELNSIRELLENKAKLLEKILINEFIYKYENNKVNFTESHWNQTKHEQIQIISLFAYYLTFEQNNLENASLIGNNIIEYLMNKTKDLFNYEKSFYLDLFDDFKKHSILTLKGDYIGFDKKEVRLFFASCYLVSQIKNIDDYTKFKNDFKGDTDSWESIENYVFGLIEPSIFLKHLNSFVVKDQIIYNNLFFQQLEYAQKFIYAGKFSQKFKLLDKFYFLNTIVMILFNYLKFEKDNKTDENFKIIIELFFVWYRKSKLTDNNYLSFLIPRANYYFNSHYLGKQKSNFQIIYKYREILKSSQSKLAFKDIRIDNVNFNNLNFTLENPSIFFSNINNSPDLIFSFLDNLIFNPIFRIKANSYHIEKYNYALKELVYFLEQFFKLNAHSYLDYYFSTHNPTPLSLKTLYEYFQKNNIKIDSQKILAITKTTIINHFDVLAYHNTTKGIYKFTLLISRVLNNILDSEIKNEVLDKWSKEIFNKKTEQKTKERLFIIYANHLREKDTSLFMSFLDDINIEFQYNAIWGLTKYISSYPNKDKVIVNQVNEKLHNLFNNSNIDLKIRIIIVFTIFRTYPTQKFLNDIIKFANQNKDNEIDFLEYFGNACIDEAIPYLKKKLHRYDIISLIAFDALVKINAENHYKYNISFIEKSRISINSQLENLKQIICDKQLNDYNIDVINYSLLIGDETTFTIIKDLREMTFFNDKTSLNSEDKKLIRKTYDNLFTKINNLQQTNYYKENFLNKKSPDN